MIAFLAWLFPFAPRISTNSESTVSEVWNGTWKHSSPDKEGILVIGTMDLDGENRPLMPINQISGMGINFLNETLKRKNVNSSLLG